MCQLLLWLSSPMPRWEIRWIWSINQFICFHFYSGHSSLRISEASRPKIGVAMSGLLLNISLQGVKVSGARYQISRDLFVCPSSRLEVLLSSGQNEIISLQWLTEMSHHQQKVCFDCKNKIETKKFIACIKTFAGKDESHIETSSSKVKSVQKGGLLAGLYAYDRYAHLQNSHTFTFLVIIPDQLSSSQVIYKAPLCQNTYNAVSLERTNFPEWSSVQLMCFLHLFFTQIFVGSGNDFVSYNPFLSVSDWLFLRTMSQCHSSTLTGKLQRSLDKFPP